MEKIHKTKWQTTDKRFVAFFDILGFKDMVMRSNHEEIYNKLESINATKKLLLSLPFEADFEEKVGNGDVYIVNFSDSIVLFSKNDDLENFEYFLICCRYLIAQAIRTGIPIKGGVAYGEVSLNKSEQIYFGQSIIDAYLVEEEVNYFGVVLHNSVDRYIIENRERIRKSTLTKIVFECETPLKCGSIIHSNIDWFLLLSREGLEPRAGEDMVKQSIINFRNSISGSPRKYVDNTLKVYDLRVGQTKRK